MNHTRRLFLVGSLVAMAACSGSPDDDDPGGTATGTGTGSDPCQCHYGAYVPVCGVDGRTYDATCGTQCVAAEIACHQQCPCPSCETLEADYQDALGHAKQCDPALDVEQCTVIVPDELACPCDTHANGESLFLNGLESIRTDWIEMGCNEDLNCPTVECPSAGVGVCTPDADSGDTGSCADHQAGSGG